MRRKFESSNSTFELRSFFQKESFCNFIFLISPSQLINKIIDETLKNLSIREDHCVPTSSKDGRGRLSLPLSGFKAGSSDIPTFPVDVQEAER